MDYLLAKYSDHISEYPIYGEDWLEKKGKTLVELKAEIPRLQTYRKGAGERIPDWDLLEASVFGTDVSRQMVRISMMNLVLHGIRHAKLKRANSLSDMGGLTDDDLRRRYKVILSNPPFSGQLPKDSIRADLAHRTPERANTAVPLVDDAAPRPRRPLRRCGSRRSAVWLDRRACGTAQEAGTRL